MEGIYRENKSKAYAFLWQHCAIAMQTKIEARKDYQDLKGNQSNSLRQLDSVH